MAEETHYTANTGITRINTANSNLDGSGTLGTVITAGANGTLIKSISIKAIGNTTSGMVRLFVDDGSNTRLLYEVMIPSVRPGANNPAFEEQLILNMTLEAGYTIKASTQNAENFNIIAEGMDWSYYSTSVRPDTTQQTANNGRAAILTANSNLDGSGTLGTVYTAGSSPTYNGSSIRSITIKSITNVTTGMVRIFLQDGASNIYLLTEVMVDTETKSNVDEAFERTIIFEDDLDIQPGYSILASTQVAETFWVFVEGTDWNYAP